MKAKRGAKKVKQFFATGGFEFLSALEDKFDCASVCTVPLFYITKSVGNGRPIQDCIDGLVEGLSSSMGLAGLMSVITGIILVVACIGAFPLCMGPKDEEEEPEAVKEFDNIKPGNAVE